MKRGWLLPALCLALPAQAADFELGPVSGALNTRVSFGAAMRVQERDNRLVGKLNVPGQQDLCVEDDCQSAQGNAAPNQRLVDARGSFSGVNEDNGNLNYDRGDLSAAIFQIRPKLEVVWEDWQFQASGLLFHDVVNSGFDETHNDTRFQPRHTRRSGAVEDLYASGHRLGNLFVARSFALGDHELLVKVGNQVLNWGEANVVQFNTLAEISPLDAPVLGMPGSEPSQLQLAVPLAVASITLTEELALEALYQLQWRGAKLPAAGSLLSFSDIAGRGDYAITGFGNYSEDPEGQFSPAGLVSLVSQSTRTLHIPDESFGAPRDDGQYGLRLNYLADWLNNGTELAFHYLHYHSRYPLLSGYAADASCTRDSPGGGFAGALLACQGFNASFNPLGLEPLPVDSAQLFLDYPEDIDLYGISFNTNLGDWALSGEYAFRPNQPLQVLQSDVLFAVLGPAFPAQDIPIGAATLSDPNLLAMLPAPLLPAVQNLQSALTSMLPAGALFTLPGEDNAAPDFLSRYRGKSIGAGDYVPGYERQKVSQMTLTGIRNFVDNPVGASQILWVIEGAALLVHDMPDRGELYFEGAGDRTHPSAGADGTGTPDGQPDTRHVNPTQMRSGFGDDLAYGYRSLLRLTYNELPGNITLYPTFLWLHDLKGISPAPIINFIEGRKVLVSSLTAEFENDWTAGVSYQMFTGGGTHHRLRDRDNVSLFVACVF
ncbi:DUF1302 family protein [Solimonas sp. K1W22B-7]|uniref:DUF1302 domain-containing protein n=1 Tax=Solimonas sp. K1W22B-7 TaxID=2303331 RepID=UPI000E32E575|nr:DUF1302 family protein [Solimonas sp. K1W22B-7]AXQ27797.1 DUF1302 family protein [Solimonas sp. K1W22B-7]